VGKCRKQALAEACAVCSPRSRVNECYGDFSTTTTRDCGFVHATARRSTQAFPVSPCWNQTIPVSCIVAFAYTFNNSAADVM
jgi:hypothetical protein